MEYSVNITIEAEEESTIGFAQSTETNRSITVEVDKDERNVTVEKEPDSSVDEAINNFLEDLGIEEVELSD